MNPPEEHTANLLGAFGLALVDRVTQAMTDASDAPLNDAVALSALQHFLDQTSIDLLAQVLGLTHSGAVRLVDRLEAAKSVTRTPGADRRTAVVSLTDDGLARARAVTAARAQVLENVLMVLSVEDRQTMDRLLGTVLARMVRGPGSTRWVCRSCDTDACGRPAGRCPVAEEARRLQG